VQFYEAEPFLIERVGRYLRDGFSVGDRLLVVATRSHVAALKETFRGLDDGFDVTAACASGRLEFLDAEDSLAELMVDGAPDAGRFRELIGSAFATAAGPSQPHHRVYGEMVDLLWQRGQGAAALRLEAFWNELQQHRSFELMCAYRLAAFGTDEGGSGFHEVCGSHTHVLPTERVSAADDAGARLREICRLEQRSVALEHEASRRKQLEAALEDASKLHRALAEELRGALAREQLAAARQKATEQFRSELLRVVGWDLRGPLQTILSTSRLLILRGELLLTSEKRMARVVSSGERMLHMLAQLLDIIAVRLHGHLMMEQPVVQDVGLIACRVADQFRVANPLHPIEVQIGEPCVARVAGERIEQVFHTLIGNAVVHGDVDGVVTVQLCHVSGQIRIRVHNFGPPIAPEKLSALLEPAPRSSEPSALSEGLGLGVQLSRQIVEAHGGTIEVTSSELTGTCFQVRLPAT
jgi:signal transduction histidine kinase